MAITIAPETVSVVRSNVKVPLGLNTSTTPANFIPVVITFKHIVDYSNPFFVAFGHGATPTYPTAITIVGNSFTGGGDGTILSVLKQSDWEGMNIANGETVSVTVIPPLSWKTNAYTSTYIDIKVNGGSCSPSNLRAPYRHPDSNMQPSNILISNARDVVVHTAAHATNPVVNYTITKVLLQEATGLLSEDNLNEGFTTTQSGTTTAVIPITETTEVVQVVLSAAHKRTSPRTGTAKVAVKLGGVTASISPPLQLANQNAQTALSLTIDKKTHPAYDFSKFEHTLTLTPQA